MKTLLKLLKWDLLLQVRYNIVTIALIISLLYILLIKSIPVDNLDPLLMLCVLSDPTMFGVLFVGVLVLYEKDSNTLNALIVTPIKSWQYLWSKAITLTTIAVPIALAISIVGHGIDIKYIYLLLSVILSSVMFVFLGFAIVTSSKGFNQFVIKFAVFTIPVSIPILALFDLVESNLFYIIPSQATILLLKAGFNYSITTWQVLYSITYLLIWLLFSLYLAEKAYNRNLLNGKRDE